MTFDTEIFWNLTPKKKPKKKKLKIQTKQKHKQRKIVCLKMDFDT